MLCCKCKQNMAVVFINKFENGKQVSEGYCLACAKELGIKPLEQMMNQLGISDNDIDELNAEMGDFLSGLDISDSMTLPANMNSEDGSREQTKGSQKGAPKGKDKKSKTE